VLIGLVLSALALPVCNRYLRLGLIQWWCRGLLRALNIQLKISGQVPSSHCHGTMLVANHISWVDIHAINSVIPVRFVAKMEIKSWPIFGYLVKKSGTIFIDRTSRRDASRVVDIISLALKQDDNICFFPEGTTTEGLSVWPFKSSILQAALNAQATVIPLTIRYPLASNQPNIAAAYAGETTLIESIDSFLNMKKPVVHLHFSAPIGYEASHTRQTLAKQAEHIIAQHL
jgi:1-acyl-sn-glycerol-3-phosphate acyltransferase